jgi:hypothetical protein
MSGTANSSQTLGIVEIYWNGSQVPIEPGATFTLGGLRNTPVIVGAQVMRAQKMFVSEINATSVVAAGQNVSDAFTTGEGELQIQCDTLQMFVWPDAFLIDAVEITAGEGGKVKLKWNAGTPQESVGTQQAS